MPLPLEILEKIASYTDGYVCCVLGLNPSSPHLRQCMFQSGGPGRTLSEILIRGGDARALFTIKDHVPPEIAIAKAVETGDEKTLDTVIAVWDTNVSDGGLKLAIERDVPYAVDVVKPSLDETIRHRNAYYISKGRYDDVDRSIDRPYDEVFAIPDRSKLQEVADQCSTAMYPIVIARCSTPQEFLDVFVTWDGGVQEKYADLIGTGLDPEVVIGISNMGFGSRDSLDRERLTKEQIMRTTKWQGRHLRDLFTHGFVDDLDVRTVENAVGTLIKEGMEEDLLGYLESNPHMVRGNMVAEVVTHLGHEKALSGRWGKVLHESLCRSAISLIFTLGGVFGDALIGMGYELALHDESIYYELPWSCVMKLLELHGRDIMYQVKMAVPTSIEETIRMMTLAREYEIRSSSGYRPEMIEGIFWVPERVHVSPYVKRGWYSWITSVDRWLLAADMTLCAMSM